MGDFWIDHTDRIRRRSTPSSGGSTRGSGGGSGKKGGCGSLVMIALLVVSFLAVIFAVENIRAFADAIFR